MIKEEDSFEENDPISNFFRKNYKSKNEERKDIESLNEDE